MSTQHNHLGNRSFVLKCWFYYYSGMVRPTDQEIAVTEKIIIVPRLCRATEGSPWTGQEARTREQGTRGQPHPLRTLYKYLHTDLI